MSRREGLLQFSRPQGIQEVIDRLERHGSSALVLAGGTALGLMLKQELIEPTELIHIAGLQELRHIQVDSDVVRIGALATLQQVADNPGVRRTLPSLADACARVGNIRVRKTATLGGNLCEADYASDPPSVLINLGAKCHALGPAGPREIPVAGFIVDAYETALEDSEILSSISVPIPPPTTRTAYVKYISRSSEDRSCVCVAASVDVLAGLVSAVDVVVGAATVVPQRFDEVCSAFVGSAPRPTFARELGQRCAEAIEPISDGRGSAWYRKRMTEVNVCRALEACIGAVPTGSEE